MTIETTRQLEEQPILPNISDPDMLELVEMFVDDAPEKANVFVNLLEQGAWNEIRQFAHQLKGSAAGYGFPCLTDAAGQLEVLIQTNTAVAQWPTSVENVIQLLRRIRVA